MIRSHALEKALVLAIAVGSLLSGGCRPPLSKLCPASDVEPFLLAVDPSLGGAADEDGPVEPGAASTVAPTWRNVGRTVRVPFSRPCPANPVPSEVGNLSGLAGPGGSTYAIDDGTAGYGAIPRGHASSCVSQGDCYSLLVSAPSKRPLQHWDASFTESLTGTQLRTHGWWLHLGGSFEDVPRSNSFYKAIETLFHNGVTEGCKANEYCPSRALVRSELMVFSARASAGGESNVPADGVLNGQPYRCGDAGISAFADVSATDPFCKHVHFIAANNVDVACDASHFCPDDRLPRAELATLLSELVLAPGGDSAVPFTYGPDPSTGRSYSCDPASPSLHFSDAGPFDPFCRHAHYLWARGILEGCSPEQFCATDDVARDEIAGAITKAFHLRLDTAPKEIPPATAATSFYTLPPCRAVDTRSGEPLVSGADRTFYLVGTCGIPGEARAISLNVTAIGAVNAGSVQLYPALTPLPVVAIVDFPAGQTRANNAVIGLTGGALAVRMIQPVAGGTADLVIDINGYFQ